MTEAQLDWCLLMQAQDAPGTLVITRGGKETAKPAARVWIDRQQAWDQVLIGEALAEHQNSRQMSMLQEAADRVKREKRQFHPGVGALKPTLRVGPLKPKE